MIEKYKPAKEVCEYLTGVACTEGMDAVILGLKWFLQETTTSGIEKVRRMTYEVRSRDGER